MLTGRRGLRWDTKFKCLVVVWKETKVIRNRHDPPRKYRFIY